MAVTLIIVTKSGCYDVLSGKARVAPLARESKRWRPGARVSESQHLQIPALGGLDSVRDRPRETCRFAGSRDEGVDSQVRSTINGMQRRSQWQLRLGNKMKVTAINPLDKKI